MVRDIINDRRFTLGRVTALAPVEECRFLIQINLWFQLFAGIAVIESYQAPRN
jgi:hypothetical protein